MKIEQLMFEIEYKAIIVTTVQRERGYGAVFVTPFPIETIPWGSSGDNRNYTKVLAISNNTMQWWGQENARNALNEKQYAYSYICLGY